MAIAISVAACKVIQPNPIGATRVSRVDESLSIPPVSALAQQGYDIFMRNCAHCHGADAHGDEGPDLHGATKSEARIASLIKNGIQGEMPKFGAKLGEDEIRALIAFISSLREPPVRCSTVLP